MWESQTEKFGKGKVAILKDLGVLDVGRWIGGASWAVWGKGRVAGVSYLAGRFTSRVTTTWLTSIGPPTGRSGRDGPIQGNYWAMTRSGQGGAKKVFCSDGHQLLRISTYVG